MISHGPLALLARFIELRDCRQHWMVNREILVQIRHEALMSHAGVDALVRRPPEERLPATGNVLTAVAMAGKCLVSLFQRVETEVNQRRLVRLDDPSGNDVDRCRRIRKLCAFPIERFL